MCVDYDHDYHWQVRLPEVVSAVLAEPDKFRDLYRFTYRVSDDDGIDDDDDALTCCLSSIEVRKLCYLCSVA